MTAAFSLNFTLIPFDRVLAIVRAVFVRHRTAFLGQILSKGTCFAHWYKNGRLWRKGGHFHMVTETFAPFG